MCADGTEGSSTVGGVVTSLTLDANGQYHFRTDTGQGQTSQWLRKFKHALVLFQ